MNTKKITAVIVALIMCISIIPLTAFATEESQTIYSDSRGNEILVEGGERSWASKVVEFISGKNFTNKETHKYPEAILGPSDYNDSKGEGAVALGAGGVIVLEFDVLIVDGEGLDIYVFEVGSQVEATKVEVSNDLENWYYVGKADGSLSGVDLGSDESEAPSDMKWKYVRLTDLKTTGATDYTGADVDAVSGLNVKEAAEGSEWANPELEKADMYGLIPEVLVEADLTQKITRAEFAAVSVKTYEALSGTKALPSISNPFLDTNDVEVLKAYNLGVAIGVSKDKFEPDTSLNREQCATMLTRVFKRATIPGWDINADVMLKYEMPPLFADDDQISDWAKDSIYFMSANNIIKGIGNNKYGPRNITAEDEATGYANATREQALIIALRMVEELSEK